MKINIHKIRDNTSITNNRLGKVLYDKYLHFYKNKEEADLLEFSKIWEKTFLQQRNVITRQLRKEIIINTRNIIDEISDNVIITIGLNDMIDKIVNRSVLVVEHAPFQFVKNIYPEITSGTDIIHVDDLVSSQALEYAISQAQLSKKNILLGIGGGRTMDMLKFIGLKSNKPMIAIQSSLATHVYASPKIHCLPAIREMGFSLTIDGFAPHLSILDLNLLSRLFQTNKRLIYSGLGDILAFVNSREDWILACKKGHNNYSTLVDDYIGMVISQLSSINVDKPLSEWIAEYSFIQVLLCNITDWAGSATASGAEHLFAKCIENEVEDTPLHGEMVALGTLIFTYMRKGQHEKVLSLMRKFNIPNSLSSLGVNTEAVVNALSNALNEGIRKKRYTILNELNKQRSFFDNIIRELIQSGFIGE